jgi:hypothetical protein
LFICDQGGEFTAAVNTLLDDFSITSKVAGSHAPWQNGLAERHGSILGAAWTAICKAFEVSTNHTGLTALACAVQAKNATVQRHGLTEEAELFGRPLRWPSLINDGEDPIAAIQEGSAGWVTLQMRNAAKLALIHKTRVIS